MLCWFLPYNINQPCCCCSVAKSCPALKTPWAVACQVPSVQGMSQARILEWVAISFSRGSSLSRDKYTCFPSLYPLPSHPSRLSAPDWAPSVIQPLSPSYFTSGEGCFNTPLSIHPTLSFPHCVHKSVCLYSCPANRFINTIFLNSMCMFSVQLSSVAQSCLTLCNPMDCSTPGFPVHHQLLEPQT